MDLIQQFAFGTALWKGLLVDALFAGTFYQIPDFEVVFIFEPFFCHFFNKICFSCLIDIHINLCIIAIFLIYPSASEGQFQYHRMLSRTSQFRFKNQ